MGLPGVLKQLIPILRRTDKNVGFRLYKLKEFFPVIENFCIDFNALFYKAFTRVAGIDPENITLKEQFEKQLTKQIREEMIMDDTLKQLEDILKHYKVTNALYIAVDGVAPASKMNQQRLRRWKSAYKKKSAVEDKFDTNAFTPGTPFMVKFHERMKKWINEKGSNYSQTIYYDSFLTAGEGEHKIMSFLRNNNFKGANVIYGMDADLLMLSVVNPTKKILLVREDIVGDDQVLNVEVIRNTIAEKFSPNKESVSDYEQSLRDFVLIMTIFGSDFFPRIISLSDTERVMNEVMARRELVKDSIGSEDGSFDVQRLMNIFKVIPEKDLLEEKATVNFIFPDPFLQESAEILQVSEQGDKEVNGGVNEGGEDKEEGGKAEGGNEVRLIVKSFDFVKYRKLWYTNLLKTSATVNPHIRILNEDGTPKNAHEINLLISNVVKEYLTGIAWIYRYYVQGLKSISQIWFYPYTYAPLLIDLVSTKHSYKSLFAHFKDKQPTHPIIQLLLVLPPKSSKLISSLNMRSFMEDPDLASFYREQFDIQYIGVNEEWKGVPIIAPADIKRVEGVINLRLAEKKFYQSSLASATVDLNPEKPVKYSVGENTNKDVDAFLRQKEIIEIAKEEGKARRDKIKREEKKETFFKPDVSQGEVPMGKGRGRGRGRGRGQSETSRGRGQSEATRGRGRGQSEARGARGRGQSEARTKPSEVKQKKPSPKKSIDINDL